MGSYKLTRKADDDLAGLYLYGLTSFGLQPASRYYDSLETRLQDIADDPLRFPPTDYREGYRRSVHAPYAIYYRIIDPQTVEIVRILRGQDPREQL